MSQEVQRILDFDTRKTVPVRFAGRDFVIRQDTRRVIEQVLLKAHSETQEDEKAAERSVADVLFKNFEDSCPTLALILGFVEGTPEFAEVVELMANDLPPDAGSEIFTAWWDLNKIDDFFLKGGKVTLPPYIVKLMREDGSPLNP